MRTRFICLICLSELSLVVLSACAGQVHSPEPSLTPTSGNYPVPFETPVPYTATANPPCNSVIPPTEQPVPTFEPPLSTESINGIFISSGRQAQDCLTYYRMFRFRTDHTVESALIKVALRDEVPAWPIPDRTAPNYGRAVDLYYYAKSSYAMKNGVLEFNIKQRNWLFNYDNGRYEIWPALGDVVRTEYWGRYFGGYFIVDEYLFDGGQMDEQLEDEYRYTRIDSAK